MLIREQGRSIKLLRIERSEASRRHRHVVIGVFRVDEDVPAALLEQLGRNERRELSQWLTAYRDSQAMARKRAILAEAPMYLDELVAALDVAAEWLAPVEADALWHKLRAVARGLQRAGHPRPKRAAVRLRPLPGQLDLIDAPVAPSSSPTMDQDVFAEE